MRVVVNGGVNIDAMVSETLPRIQSIVYYNTDLLVRSPSSILRIKPCVYLYATTQDTKVSQR